MVTGKDREHLPLAHLSLRSFEEQTYPYKAMIILNDGELSTLQNTSFVRNPCICERRVRKAVGQKLGTLRNMLMRMVPAGKVWMQWDDDDYRSRECMQGQLQVMMNNASDMVFLRRQIHVDMLWNSTFKYEYGGWGLWGTLMVNTSKPAARTLELPNLDRGEDLYYDDLRAQLRHTVWDNEPQQYFRIIHGRNTWNRAHFKPDLRFRRNTWCLLMDRWCTDEVKDKMRAIFDLYGKAALSWNVSSLT